MQRFSFKRGLVFIEQNLRWKLDRRLASGKLQFANETGEINLLKDTEVLSLWRRGDWILDDATIGSQADVIYQVSPRDLSTFPEIGNFLPH